jgi:hypothetical protein
MLRPDLRPRIEQRTELLCLRVKGREVAPLVAVAAPAGERQIINVGRPTVLLGYDVVYLVRVEGDFGRK